MRKQFINYPDNLPLKISYKNIKYTPLRWDESIQIIYIINGSLNITVDSNSFILEEDNIEIININESYELSSDTSNKTLIIHIDPSFFEKYYSDIYNLFFYTNSNEFQFSEKYVLLKSYISKLLYEYTEKLQEFDKEIEKILLDLLFHLINNFHYLTYENDDLREKTDHLNRYHRISKYIFNNYTDNITLKDIAKKEFLSTDYLSHEIKYATGYSFTELMNLTRVEESIKLLLDSDISISEISDRVGFSHTRYYNKSFKQYYNLTPLQYRKKYFLSISQFNEKLKLTSIPLKEAILDVSPKLSNYDRFNFENKLWNINIDMNSYVSELPLTFKEVINLGESFDLLIEDNKDILEEIQDEIHFNYGRLEKMFSSDMGVFIDSDFYNWNKAKAVLEFLTDISLIPLILIDNPNFSFDKYKQILLSFVEYFSESDYFNINIFKFQFSDLILPEIKNDLKDFLELDLNFETLDILFHSTHNLNPIYDTTYMLPYIIHNSLFSNNSLDNLIAFDVLEKATNITNEVFIGSPGLVNDLSIRKPSYYAYYLLSKLGSEIISLDDGYIVTKGHNYYAILLYSHSHDLNKPIGYTDIIIKKSYKKKLSLNIININHNTRVTSYEINRYEGSSYDYWMSMGSPDRLNKEEKEILYKASYPKIEFKFFKRSTVLNIITELNGYSAKLIVLNKIKNT